MNKILYTLCLSLLALNLFANKLTVNVPTAGGLSTAITAAGGNASLIDSLAVTGNIDARDIYFMRDSMPLLAILNMNASNILAYSNYKANQMPENSFYNYITLQGKSTLKGITLPENIESICEFAFYNCTELKGDLNLQKSIKSLKNGAFMNSGYTGKLILPDSLITIEANVFNKCHFTGNLNIPNTVKSIGDLAFAECSGFTGDLIIPDSVKELGVQAFFNCSGFTGKLTISKSITRINDRTFSNCSKITGNINIPNSITSIGSYSFSECSGFTGNLVIPNSVSSISEGTFLNCSGLNGNLILSSSLKSIGNHAFSLCSNISGNLVFTDSLTSIGEFAFYNCINLSGSLTIPNSVISIGKEAFDNCKNFNQLILSNSITSIEERTFSDCKGLNGSLNIPDSVISIGSYAFSNCENISDTVFIPASVKSVKDFAFNLCLSLSAFKVHSDNKFYTDINGVLFSKDSCRLIKCPGSKTTFNIPNNVKIIANSAFDNCKKLKGKLIIPNSVTRIEDYAFNYCSGYNDSIKLSDSLISIGNWAFSNCWNMIGKIEIPNLVTKIGENAFYGCNKFTELLIPNSVTDIKSGAFGQTINIKRITVYKSNPLTISYNTFDGIDKLNCILKVPFGSKDAYKAKLYWKDFIRIIDTTSTVIFQSNGGSILPQITFDEFIVLKTTISVRTGYTFIGWYKDSLFTVKWDFTKDTAKSNAILYAKWDLKSFTITFNTAGGSNLDSKDAYYGTLITQPSDPTKDGYTFKGWYKESSLTNPWNFNTDSVKKITTLYAKWEKNVEVENISQTSISLYPNPASNILNIQGQNLKQAKVFNLAGKELLRVELNNSNQTELNVSSLNPGYYILKITDNIGIEKARSFVKN